MCSICGILGNDAQNVAETLGAMSAAMQNRGPDQRGTYVSGDIAFAHNRLSIIDPENGKQPMTRTYLGRTYTIIYNGELYNTPELTALVRQEGISLQTHCDTEVVLYMYILFGEKCASLLNGIFAFAVYDETRKEVYLARDRFGIKPLFYAEPKGAFIFASEIKALLRYPDIRPVVDQEGLWELLFLSPVRLTGGIFRDVEELEPAHYAVWSRDGLRIRCYWNLEARICEDDRDDAIERTRVLLTDAVERQLVSDVPLCTLLSGGLDSSIISAVAADYYKRHGMTLSTYSFEYEGNRENFHSSLFQPQSDDEYARYMAAILGTDHTVLTAPTDEVRDLLGAAVLARDFPGQADIDSSLLYYCRRIKERHTVAMSGDCADEIFGGYPWFYRPEMLENPFFPWIHDPMLRASLFRDGVAK
ncbi:MAG: asparagine synthase (glutamine-hydrolyzing), partial [Intestinibacillus sp.]